MSRSVEVSTVELGRLIDQRTYTVSNLADRLAIRLSLRRQCIKANDRRAQGHKTGQGQSTKDTDLLGLRPVLSKYTLIKDRAEPSLQG